MLQTSKREASEDSEVLETRLQQLELELLQVQRDSDDQQHRQQEKERETTAALTSMKKQCETACKQRTAAQCERETATVERDTAVAERGIAVSESQALQLQIKDQHRQQQMHQDEAASKDLSPTLSPAAKALNEELKASQMLRNNNLSDLQESKMGAELPQAAKQIDMLKQQLRAAENVRVRLDQELAAEIHAKSVLSLQLEMLATQLHGAQPQQQNTELSPSPQQYTGALVLDTSMQQHSASSSEMLVLHAQVCTALLVFGCIFPGERAQSCALPNTQSRKHTQLFTYAYNHTCMEGREHLWKQDGIFFVLCVCVRVCLCVYVCVENGYGTKGVGFVLLSSVYVRVCIDDGHGAKGLSVC